MSETSDILASNESAAKPGTRSVSEIPERVRVWIARTLVIGGVLMSSWGLAGPAFNHPYWLVSIERELGPISRKDYKKVEFTIFNPHRGDLVIEGVVTTCAIKSPQYVVKPFSALVIEASFDLSKKPIGRDFLTMGVTGKAFGQTFSETEEFEYEIVE